MVTEISEGGFRMVVAIKKHLVGYKKISVNTHREQYMKISQASSTGATEIHRVNKVCTVWKQRYKKCPISNTFSDDH